MSSHNTAGLFILDTAYQKIATEKHQVSTPVKSVLCD